MRTQGKPNQRVRKIKDNFETRQISGICQYLAALSPFFEGMRTTLKELTQHVNPRWEVRTPRPSSDCLLDFCKPLCGWTKACWNASIKRSPRGSNYTILYFTFTGYIFISPSKTTYNIYIRNLAAKVLHQAKQFAGPKLPGAFKGFSLEIFFCDVFKIY